MESYGKSEKLVCEAIKTHRIHFFLPIKPLKETGIQIFFNTMSMVVYF